MSGSHPFSTSDRITAAAGDRVLIDLSQHHLHQELSRCYRVPTNNPTDSIDYNASSKSHKNDAAYSVLPSSSRSDCFLSQSQSAADARGGCFVDFMHDRPSLVHYGCWWDIEVSNAILSWKVSNGSKLIYMHM